MTRLTKEALDAQPAPIQLTPTQEERLRRYLCPSCGKWEGEKHVGPECQLAGKLVLPPIGDLNLAAEPVAQQPPPRSEPNVMATDNNMAGNTNATPVYELCAQICDEMADRGPPEMAFAAAHCAAAIREAAPAAEPVAGAGHWPKLPTADDYGIAAEPVAFTNLLDAALGVLAANDQSGDLPAAIAALRKTALPLAIGDRVPTGAEPVAQQPPPHDWCADSACPKCNARYAAAPQPEAPTLVDVRDGNFLDSDGCCKVCDGEIPYGHTQDCDIWKLEQRIRELEAAAQQPEAPPALVATMRDVEQYLAGMEQRNEHLLARVRRALATPDSAAAALPHEPLDDVPGKKADDAGGDRGM